MLRTIASAKNVQPINRATANRQPLSALLSNSEDEFYGSLQRIWNNVVQLEDMGIIHNENDKFAYAYRFAEAELKRLCSEKNA